MVAVPGCVGLWLLSMKRWKELAVLTAVWMAVVASGFAIAQSVTDGLLAVNLSGAKFGKLALVYSRDSLLRLLTVIPGSGFVVVLFSLGGIGTYLGFTEPDRRYRLLSLYVLTSLGAAIIGSSAAGGDVNHYLESALVFSLLAPYCASRIEQEADGKPTLLWFAGALVALLMGTGLYTERPAVLRAQRQDLSEVRRLVEHRRVFSDVPYLAARSSTPEALDAASLTYAARTGSWSGATIVSSLSRQEYELVALSAPVDSLVDTGLAFPRYPHLSPAIGAAIRENYRLCSTVDGVLIYRPFSGDNVGCP
jgi:hypothetical protein